MRILRNYEKGCFCRKSSFFSVICWTFWEILRSLKQSWGLTWFCNMFAALKGWGRVVGWSLCWVRSSFCIFNLEWTSWNVFGSFNNQKRSILEGLDLIRLELCICSPSSHLDLFICAELRSFCVCLFVLCSCFLWFFSELLQQFWSSLHRKIYWQAAHHLRI